MIRENFLKVNNERANERTDGRTRCIHAARMKGNRRAKKERKKEEGRKKGEGGREKEEELQKFVRFNGREHRPG